MRILTNTTPQGKQGRGRRVPTGFNSLPIEFPTSRGERVPSNLQQDWKSRTDPRASLENGPAPTSLNLSVWIS